MATFVDALMLPRPDMLFVPFCIAVDAVLALSSVKSVMR